MPLFSGSEKKDRKKKKDTTITAEGDKSYQERETDRQTDRQRQRPPTHPPHTHTVSETDKKTEAIERAKMKSEIEMKFYCNYRH